MFDNCKKCFFYYKRYDDLCREHDDEEDLDGNSPNNHFCLQWRRDNESVIPQDVWGGKTLCPHYVTDK